MVELMEQVQFILDSSFTAAPLDRPEFGNQTRAYNSCGSWFPLADKHANSLNPCFVSTIFALTALAAICFGGAQLGESLFYRKNFGSYCAKAPVYYIRAVSVLFQGLMYAIIASAYVGASLPISDIKVIGFLLTAILCIFILLPLHVCEVKSRIIPSATLLIFWPWNAMINAAIMFQQIFSGVRVFEIDVERLDTLLFVNALLVFYMEYWMYTPTEELVQYYQDMEWPLDTPDVISRATFAYINPLMSQGVTSRSITEEDILEPMDLDKTEVAAQKIARYWDKQKTKKKPSLGLSVLSSVAITMLCSMTLQFTENLFLFSQPQLLRLLIKFFNSDKETPLITGFALAASLFVCSVSKTAIFNKYFILNFEASMRAKAGLMALIYQKSLRLSPEARAEKSTGQIVNLMSVDVLRVQEVASYVQELISAPTKLILCCFSLHALLGNALWGGIAVMVFMIPINTYLARSMRSLHKQQMVYKDKRSRLVNDILTSIKSIKLYSWENPMLDRLRHVRNNEELKNLKKIGMFSAFVNFSWNSVPFFVSCATFALFAAFSKKPLTSDLIFPALSLFDLLGEPIFAIPGIITGLIELNIALTRISSFLLADEIDDSFVTRSEGVRHKGEVSLEIKNSTFYWSKPTALADVEDEEREIATPKVALSNVDFEAKKGELSCVVGRVGSGKSTFMQAILGELACSAATAGKPAEVLLRGDVAYCAQVPWIMNASVRENILFGKRYEEDFYNRTVKACQLAEDLDILPDGDSTLVGEKGISLSGGQKARISLARAVYKRADIYLLDDILSAVDAHVGKHITDQVLSTHGLLSSKTVILATNSVPILSHSKNIILLEHGEITERGTFQEVSEAKSSLFELIKEYGRKEKDDVEDPNEGASAKLNTTPEEGSTSEPSTDLEEKDDEVEAFTIAASNIDSTAMVPLERSVSHQTLRRPSNATLRRVPLNFDKDPKKQSQQAESVEKGTVKKSVYIAYAKACSISGCIFYISFIVASAVFSAVGNYWLKHWSEQNGKNGANEHVGRFVGIYVIFGLTSGFCNLLNIVTMWVFCAIKGSMALHDGMATSILKAPMSFFETTPIGRIMNRFSNDMNRADEYLPRTFSMFFRNGTNTFLTLCIISVSMPKFLVIMGVLSFLYVYFQRYFAATSRQLKRMQSVAMSPIYAHLQETLTGSETIRAYDDIARFIFLNAAHIDFHAKMFYAIRAVNRWISTRLQFIGSIIIFSAASLAVLTRITSNPMSAGLVGLVMSYALQITNSLNWMVRMSVEVETSIVSVERILEYSKLRSEAPQVIESNRPPSSWPNKGEIKFVNYSTKYRANLDPVLKNISLEIKPEEKVGIVGRTGAGKSTLTSSIYRLIEPTEGHIEIDGVNTSDIGLYDLRHKLSIIPQDSQVLEGTVRQNLDPFDDYSDEQLWNALRLSHLETVVNEMNSPDDPEAVGLKAKLTEGGSNLSVGQRQLMCLARALLSTSKILILDEATAAVDVQTDKILQETIRTEFKNKTILTIAHRLDTVLDSDKIIVLDKGCVKEFDSPQNLLKDTSSIFYSLCERGGYLKN